MSFHSWCHCAFFCVQREDNRALQLRIKRCCNRLPLKQNKKCSDCDCVCLKYDMQFMHLTYPKWDKVGFQEVFGWITLPSLGIVNSPNSRWVYEVFPDLISTWPFTKPWISSQHPTGTRRALKPRSLFGSRRVCELSIQRCSCFRLQRICKDTWQKVHICPVWHWQRVLQKTIRGKSLALQSWAVSSNVGLKPSESVLQPQIHVSHLVTKLSPSCLLFFFFLGSVFDFIIISLLNSLRSVEKSSRSTRNLKSIY